MPRADMLIAYPQPRHDPRPEAFNENIGALRKLQHGFAPLRRAQIHHRAALAAIDQLEEPRQHRPGVIAIAGPLDFDDFRPQIR
jgi:hypothetical protein